MRYYTRLEWEEMIVEEITKVEEVTIGKLAEKFNTSRITIKPALEVLKEKGLIKAVYRGRSVVYCMGELK